MYIIFEWAWERQQYANFFLLFHFDFIHNNIINLFNFRYQTQKVWWQCLKSLKNSSSFEFHHRHVCSLFFSYAIDFPMADWLLYVMLVNAYINSLFISSFHLLTIFFLLSYSIPLLLLPLMVLMLALLCSNESQVQWLRVWLRNFFYCWRKVGDFFVVQGWVTLKLVVGCEFGFHSQGSNNLENSC